MPAPRPQSPTPSLPIRIPNGPPQHVNKESTYSVKSVASHKSTIQRLHLHDKPQHRINSSFASLSKGWFLRLASNASRKSSTGTFLTQATDLGEDSSTARSELSYSRHFADTQATNPYSGLYSKLVVVLFLTLVVTGIVIVAVQPTRLVLSRGLQYIKEHQVYGSFLFILTFVISCIVCFPEILIIVGAGFIFDNVIVGIFISYVSGIMGSCVAFMIGRAILRPVVIDYMFTKTKLCQEMERTFVIHGWWIAALLRLSYLPFTYLNYILSATSIPFSHFALSTALASIPGCIFFPYFGNRISNIDEISSGRIIGLPFTLILYFVGIVATLFTFYTIQKIKKIKKMSHHESAGTFRQDSLESARRLSDMTGNQPNTADALAGLGQVTRPSPRHSREAKTGLTPVKHGKFSTNLLLGGGSDGIPEHAPKIYRGIKEPLDRRNRLLMEIF